MIFQKLNWIPLQLWSVWSPRRDSNQSFIGSPVLNLPLVYRTSHLKGRPRLASSFPVFALIYAINKLWKGFSPKKQGLLLGLHKRHSLIPWDQGLLLPIRGRDAIRGFNRSRDFDTTRTCPYIDIRPSSKLDLVPRVVPLLLVWRALNSCGDIPRCASTSTCTRPGVECPIACGRTEQYFP